MADREQSAEQVFAEALELQPERRAAFLDQACRGAPEVRAWLRDCFATTNSPEAFSQGPSLPPTAGLTFLLLSRPQAT